MRTADGRLKLFDVPGAGTSSGQGTEPLSLNSLGVIAGIFKDSNDVKHGFVRTPDGKITTFNAPRAGTGAYQGTVVISNNLEGEITGWSIDENNVSHGFTRTADGRFTLFDVAGAGTDPDVGEGTFPYGNNFLGAVTGAYVDANQVNHGFLRTP
jgi:hypothetical protein